MASCKPTSLWIAAAIPGTSSTQPVLSRLAEAEKRFRDLTGNGFRAVALGRDGDNVLLGEFDPDVEQTLFLPQLVGG